VRELVNRWGKSSAIVFATILLVLASAIFEPSALHKSALAAVWPFTAVLIIAALGQTLVIQQRGIDLSVPGYISLTVIVVTHMPNGNSSKLFESIVLIFVINILAGLFSGFMVTKVGMSSIVQTLGMNAILYGIDIAISHGTPTQTTSALQDFTSKSFHTIPITFFIALFITAIVAFIMKKTMAGRRFEASGANDAAGVAAGLRTDRYQSSAYVGAAILYTIAGILLAGIVSQPDSFQGDAYLLSSVAAVVLGGTSLLGGSGSAVATAVGAFFLVMLQQFILATGASAAVQDVVEATALAVGVGIYGFRSQSAMLIGALRQRFGLKSSTAISAPSDVEVS
jgi:ribose transport system permease protein